MASCGGDILKSVCCTCLSNDRKLFPVHMLENCLDNLFSLSSFDVKTDKKSFYMQSSELSICWECKAIMMKFSTFRQQVCIAQDKLARLFSHGVENMQEQILSNLNYYHKSNYDDTIVYTNYMDNLDDNFVDCGLSNDIKTEEDLKIETTYLHEPAKNTDTMTLSEEKESMNKNEISVFDTNSEECVLRSSHSDKSVKKNYKEKKRVKKINTRLKSNPLTKQSSKKVSKNNLQENKNSEIPNTDYLFTVSVMSEADMVQNRDEKKHSPLYIDAAYKCESCIEAFKDTNELSQHDLAVHTKQNKHTQCPVCKQYVRATVFTKHKNSHYQMYKCQLCNNITYYSLTNIVKHLKHDHSIKNMKLLEEKADRKSPNSARKRMLDKKTPYGFKCEECNSYFVNKNLRWKHIQREHREGFKCPLCEKSFAFRSSLKKHELVHRGPLPREQCAVCQKQVRLDLMSAHAQTHAPRQSFSCADCQKTFACRTTYDYHLKYAKAHSTVDVLKYTCSICEKGYRSRGELRDHINYRHMGTTMHKCPICHKALATRRCITRHLNRTHGGQKEQPRDKICGQCGRGFKDKKGLTEHELIHSGERPLSCEICGVTFRQSATLYTHRRRVHKICPPKKSVVLVESVLPDRRAEMSGSNITMA